MKKVISILLVLSMLVMVFTACSSQEGTSEVSADKGSAPAAKVDISFLITKPEIIPQFQKVFDTYRKSHPNVTISGIPLSGQTIYEKLTSLYASGNAPTITMVQGPEFSKFHKNFLDLTDTKFTKQAYDWTLKRTTVGGKILAVPTTAEGIGILYNKDVIEAATGKTFDPASLKSRADLKALLEEISKTNYGAVQLSNMDWIWGSHLASTLYGDMSQDYDERQKIIQQSQDGKFDLIANPVFNGWMDTFDLLMKYNIHKDDPLSNTYEDDQLAMASGKVAFWVIGNYIYPNLADINPDIKVGLIPYFISDNTGDFGNSEICITHSLFAIDAAQSTTEEQQAAVDFFNWLITTPEGQDLYVNTLKFNPTYEGFTVKPTDALSVQIGDYMAKGLTIERMSEYFPAGLNSKLGAEMQKYLAGASTRDDVAKGFKDLWVDFAAKNKK